MNRVYGGEQTPANLAKVATPPVIQDLVAEGMRHHEAGRLSEAERLYRQVLAAEPRHADALHLLGMAAMQMGRVEAAVELIGSAIGINRTAAHYHSNLGEALRALGLFDEAIAAYKTAIRIRPDFAEAHSNLGNALRDSGRHTEAVIAFNAAIRIRPDFAQAHSNLGNTLTELGRFHEAVIACEAALGINANYAEAHANLGVALRHLGRLDGAIAACETAIRIKPDFAEAHSSLGNALRGSGRFEDAVTAFNAAIRIKPTFVQAYSDLGNTLTESGRFHEAVTACEAALRIKGDYAQGHANLGVALQRLGRFDQAITAYGAAIRANPDFAEAHCNLGSALHRLERFEDAVTAYGEAIRLKPGYAVAQSNLGAALRRLGRLDDAVVAYAAALRAEPDLAEAHCNLGNTLRDLGRLDDAIAACDAAIRIKPDYAEAHSIRAYSLLQQGRYEEGWRQYEWRNKIGEQRVVRPYQQPVWLGEQDIAGKTLFIYGEQGFGDRLQFCRYVTLALEAGARVTLEVPRPLHRLLRLAHPAIQITQPGEDPGPFDHHIPMMSLPLAFGTTLKTIPATVPYLRADPDQAAVWRRRVVAFPGYKVGLVWAGSAQRDLPWAIKIDRQRSITLDQYAPLADIPGLCLISLQKGEPATQARTPPDGMMLHDWTEELDDFADTAALIEALDLVVSVDTSVVHLAGALGKPVWVLNIFDQCWRWLTNRNDSPWYPGATLFQQERPGAWDAVILRVRDELARITGSPGGSVGGGDREATPECRDARHGHGPGLDR